MGGDRGNGWEGTAETFWDDGNALHLDWKDGYMGVYVNLCQNFSNYTFKMHAFYVIKLYLKKASFKISSLCVFTLILSNKSTVKNIKEIQE